MVSTPPWTELRDTGTRGPAGADREHAHLPHLPALDGLRAIALAAVLCFHGGFTWISGGYLPLTSFFVLSGFLITSLLLLERQRSGRIDLKAFWGRRARRLVPAALVALALIVIYAAAIERPPDSLRGDVYAALGWVANWRFIFAEQTYADLWGDPSPLQHFWSLAVEEQFYLVLPLLAFSTLALARGRRWLLGGVTVVLAAGSTLWMRHLYTPGEAPLRSYFGTDTRAAELLVGVLLALLLIGPKGLRRIRGVPRYLLEMAGAAALVGTVALWFLTEEYDSHLYESGGLLLIALLAAVVVTAATQEGSLVSLILGLKPLAAMGRISYGVYLFHWPLFLWINERRTGIEGYPLFALRLAATFALAILSYRLLEQPIRLGRRLRPQLLLTGWANATVAVLGVLIVVTQSLGGGGSITLETAGEPQVHRADRSRSGSVLGERTTTTDTTGAADGTTSTTPGGPGTTADGRGGSGGRTTTTGRGGSSGPSTSTPGGGNPGGGNPGGGTTTPPPTQAPPSTQPPPPLKVMVVGDSIAMNLTEGLIGVQDRYQIDVLGMAKNGCSAIVEGEFRYPRDGTARRADGGCVSRRNELGSAIRSFDPDVVLVHSSIFDILDHRADGWGDFLSIGDPTYDSWLRGQQRRLVSDLAAGGARVVWATTPCARWDPLLQANHFEASEGNRRVRLLNGLIRQSGAVIADLYEKVCPGGSFSSTVFGVANARQWDGVHFNRASSIAMADQWLAPFLLSQRP